MKKMSQTYLNDNIIIRKPTDTHVMFPRIDKDREIGVCLNGYAIIPREMLDTLIKRSLEAKPVNRKIKNLSKLLGVK